MSTPTPDQFTLQLTPRESLLIYEALSALPYARVHELIKKCEAQMQTQLQQPAADAKG
jgi:hypothetical protein